jgi:hypothetical protein
MDLKRISLHGLDAREFSQALYDQGGIILSDVLSPGKVERALRSSRAAFTDLEYLASQPYSFEEHTGYTPAGGERTARTGRIWSRHMFDYRVGHVTFSRSDESLFASLYEDLGYTADLLLSRLDGGEQTSLLKRIGRGLQILRIAECLNEEVSLEELFPAHHDFSLLTLFVGGASSGLEVELARKWRGVSLAAGEIMVGTGSVFGQFYPGGAVLKHRVVASSVRRLSLFLYVDPAPEVVLPSGERADAFLSRLVKKNRL